MQEDTDSPPNATTGLQLCSPYPDPRDDSGWDRGLELLPAARVAVKEINNNSKILPAFYYHIYKKEAIIPSYTVAALFRNTLLLISNMKHT